MKNLHHTRSLLLLLVLLAPPLAFAQTEEEAADETVDEAAEQEGFLAPPQLAPPAPIDEIVTMGRLLSGGQSLALERMDDAAVTDLLGSDQISRAGDSTVAVALKRVPGLTLVNDQFVYIRGLGERYSQSTLNGARIPSPDLTRNVIPLDIFPTAIVESLRVQKAYTADMPANFAGGSVDVRTRGIPDQFVAQFEVGSGFNSETSGNLITYDGGDDDRWGTDDGTRALSQNLLDTVIANQGRIDVAGLQNNILRANPGLTTQQANAQALQLNRELATELNRSVTLEERSAAPDLNVRGSVGNNFILNEDWEVGFLAGATYGTNWREEITRQRNFNFPDERTATEVESTRSVNISGIGNFGVRYGDDHEISMTELFLRSTDDETAVLDFFNENREVPDGIGFRDYRFLYEEREMNVTQFRGEHTLGEFTREMMGAFSKVYSFLPTETRINWYVSDSQATTDIPNQVNISSQTVTDPVTGATLSDAVALDATAADYRFTELADEVRSSGVSITLPFTTERNVVDVTFGWDTDTKAREYLQYQFSIGALDIADPNALSGPLGDVFSDENILNPENNFVFNRQGTNNQSYLAATITDAAFGTIDWTFDDRWRVNAGLRWEDYRQVALDWNPLGFSEADPQITQDPEALANASFQRDDLFPSLAVTYISDWMAETFQLRFGYSQTAVRPDLREITDASYIDPITGDLVDGNPGVRPADVDNFDLRAEWFANNGNNYTISAFYKDIQNPIEFFESAASDTTIAREIINAESAKVYGVELEALHNLAGFGSRWEGFFVQGNLTIQDSELVAGPDADAPTNPVRQLASASNYVANVTFGWDSANGKHAATAVFNVFGERLFSSGRNGAPDAFEQPFNGLDLNYSWFPTDQLIFRIRARNVLGEQIEIQREGVTIFEQNPGSSMAVALQWNY
ncbi:MAG: TonB-dependent receptor [Pseudomonadota bacterium]